MRRQRSERNCLVCVCLCVCFLIGMRLWVNTIGNSTEIIAREEECGSKDNRSCLLIIFDIP